MTLRRIPAPVAVLIVAAFIAGCGPSKVGIDSVAPVRPGGVADVQGHTTPGDMCRIVVVLPSGRISTVRQLRAPHTADSQGRVEWRWRVTRDTTPGLGKVALRCGAGRAQADWQLSG